MDSFTSYNPKYEEENLKGYSRVNIESVLSYSIVQSSAISLKYRWFNLYSFGYKQKYRNTQLIVAFDYKTDFKIW